ncbi:hypothetical protein AB0B99_24915, partial [Micromonospora haikouensis]
MSNYLRKNDDTAQRTTFKTRRRKVWLASGVAGLTGVVSLAGIGVAGSAGAAGMDRLTNLKWSTAEQVAKDGGHGQDERGQRGTDGEDRGKKDYRGEESRSDEWGRVQEVPCDPDRLIAAIIRANADDGGTLKLARGCTYTLTVNNGPGGNGLPPITQNITIKGEDSTLVRAANATPFRFFQVASGGHLRLADLTLTGGNGLAGGAIWVQRGGAADITKSKLVNNDALAAGGAIENDGTTTLDQTIVTNNTAILAGGGISNTGLLKIHESRLAGNNAGAAGGAINNLAGTVAITKTAVTGNRSVGAGGGIASEGGIVDLDETEVTDNTTGV